ncbi:MAG: hypothetical protein LBC77_08195 [Spirochaetaceae bacterium]|jgi:hypothetical protein|nr:hypothetical protein [Spirochaetaceae bacterium]
MSKERNLGFLLVPVLFAALILCSCVTNLGAFRNDVPETEQCVLEIPASVTVREFDGQKVRWAANFFKHAFGVGKSVIQIPAGIHIFVCDWYEYNSSGGSTYTTSTARGLKVLGEAKAGKTYVIKVEKLPFNMIRMLLVEKS